MDRKPVLFNTFPIMKLDHPCGLQIAQVTSRTLLPHDVYGIKAVFELRCCSPVTGMVLCKHAEEEIKVFLPSRVGKEGRGCQQLGTNLFSKFFSIYML